MAYFSDSINNQPYNLFDKYKRIRLICRLDAIQIYDGYNRVITNIPIKPKTKHYHTNDGNNNNKKKNLEKKQSEG